MATASFDEKVVVTDPETIKWMKADLDDPTPVVHKRFTDTPIKVMTEEEVRQWLKNLK